jgi:NAD(P)H-flavin reductase
MQQTECILEARTPLTEDTNLYRFEVLGGLLVFIPGQFVSLSIPTSEAGGHLVRAYSIAGLQDMHITNSSTHSVSGTKFELIIRSIPNGKGTTMLKNMLIGTKIVALQPTGHLTVDHATSNDRSIVFVANATGIAPFRMMIQYLKEAHAYSDITILWGLKTAHDVYLLDEFSQYEEEWAIHNKKFQYYFCFSQELTLPQIGSVGHEHHVRLGRVQQSYGVLSNMAHQFFVCGGKDFVLDVKTSLETSFPGSEVCAERFN